MVRFDRSAALVSVAAIALIFGLAAPRPAHALDDDGKQNVFSALMGMIDVTAKDDAPEIDYRERPALVLPPKMDLPPPVEPGARRNAAWPNDPDVLRRKRKAEEAKIPIDFTRDGQADRTLTKEQILAHRGSSTSSASTSNLNPDLGHCAKGQCDWMKPDVLEAEGRQVRDAQGNDEGASDVITAGKEPPRKYLTEPPTGYRKATATVKATQGGPAVIQNNTDNILGFWKDMNPFKSDDDN